MPARKGKTPTKLSPLSSRPSDTKTIRYRLRVESPHADVGISFCVCTCTQVICTYQHAIAVVVKSIKHGYLDCFSHLHPAIGYRERERERERTRETFAKTGVTCRHRRSVIAHVTLSIFDFSLMVLRTAIFVSETGAGAFLPPVFACMHVCQRAASVCVNIGITPLQTMLTAFDSTLQQQHLETFPSKALCRSLSYSRGSIQAWKRQR